MNHGRRGSFRSHETELLPLLLVTTPYYPHYQRNASQVALLSVTSTKPNNLPPNHYTNPGLRLK